MTVIELRDLLNTLISNNQGSKEVKVSYEDNCNGCYIYYGITGAFNNTAYDTPFIELKKHKE